MIRVAICDDIPQDRQELRAALKQEFDNRNVPAEFFEYESGEALLREQQAGAFDFRIIFLDIYMVDMSGLETARILRDKGCTAMIVFLSVTPDFAPEGYEVEAAGYLLKPLEERKLRRLLERFWQQCAMLTFRSGTNVYTFPASDILYIESNRNVLTVHTVKENISLYGTLNGIANQLPARSFLRCHQSYLINMDRVFAAKDNFCMENGDVVPIRVRERRMIRETYFRYVTGNVV